MSRKHGGRVGSTRKELAMDFDARTVATNIESLARDALREKPGDCNAEKELVDIVNNLQRDPKQLDDVRALLVSDSTVPNGFPVVALEGSRQAPIVSVASSWHDYLQDKYQFEKIDVSLNLAAKTGTTSGTRLDRHTFDTIELLPIK
jgi:hypothetical protein